MSGDRTTKSAETLRDLRAENARLRRTIERLEKRLEKLEEKLAETRRRHDIEEADAHYFGGGAVRS